MEYKRKRRLSRLARELGFSKNRLSEILYGKRKLTLYYILKFLEAKIMTANRLFGSLQIKDLPDHRRIMAKRFLLDPQVVDALDGELQALIRDAVDSGRVEDCKAVLKSFLHAEKKRATV